MALFDCECLCVICSGIGIGVYSTKTEGGGVARCVAKLIRVDFTLGRILAYYKWVCGVFDCEVGSRPRERHWRILFILWWDIYKACIRWNN